MQMKPTFNNWHIRVAEGLMDREQLLASHWSYDFGVVWNGMATLFALTGDEKYERYIKDGVDSFLSADGNDIRGYNMEEYNLDYLCNGKQLLYLYEKTKSPRYEAAIRLLLKQMDKQPRTAQGGFWHKLIYPQQVWLDGLYMYAPFYARAAKLYGREDWFDDIVKQFLLIRERARDERTNLCRHAWDAVSAQSWADKETGCSKHVWGRATGWYMAAIVDTLDFLPKEHKGRGPLLELFNELAEAVWKVRDKEAQVWFQVLDAPGRAGNYLESSCTSLILYALAKAARLGLISCIGREGLISSYAGAVEQFIEILHGQAIVTKCCQVAGLGGRHNRDGTYAYYMSEPIVANDLKGTGAFIQAACEMEGFGF